MKNTFLLCTLSTVLADIVPGDQFRLVNSQTIHTVLSVLEDGVIVSAGKFIASYRPIRPIVGRPIKKVAVDYWSLGNTLEKEQIEFDRPMVNDNVWIFDKGEVEAGMDEVTALLRTVSISDPESEVIFLRDGTEVSLIDPYYLPTR